ARPALAVAGDRAIDQPRIDRPQRLVAEAEALYDARPELLNQNISKAEIVLNLSLVVWVFEIEYEAFLVAVQKRECGRLAIPARPVVPHVLAARPLDLDHLRAGLRQ